MKAIIITRTSRKLCRRHGRPIKSETRGKYCGKIFLRLTWKWVTNHERWCCWFGEWLELYWSYGGMQYDDTYWQIIVANVKRILINPEDRTSLIYRHWFNMAPSSAWLWAQSGGIYGRWKADWRQNLVKQLSWI